MTALYFLFGALAVLVFLLLIAVLHTLMIKPTAAQTAVSPKGDKGRAAEYGEKLAKLIQKETVSTKNETEYTKFREFQNLLREEFPVLFEKCEVATPGEGLILKLAASNPKGQPILLMSHHDVVEAPSDGWKYPPFSGHIDEEGLLWGRGTVDTKGALFCELTALEELIKEGWEPEVDVYITSSCTEEWSGPSGPAIVEWLKERNVRLGMLMDEGGIILDEPIPGVKGHYCMVGVVEKGYGDLKFIARGHSGHSSTPPKNTPLPRLGAFMADIEKHDPFKVKFFPAAKEMFGRLARNMNFPMKLLFTNIWLFGPLLKKLLPSVSPTAAAMLKTTSAFTTCNGSKGLNVLPAEAYVTANLRFISHQPVEECIDLMRERAKKYDIETEVINQGAPSSVVGHESNAFRLIEQASARFFPGYDVIPYVITGGTDARFYNDICDNALRFAPIEINQQQYHSVHAKDENITLDRLPLAVDFYKEVLINYARNPETIN